MFDEIEVDYKKFIGNLIYVLIWIFNLILIYLLSNSLYIAFLQQAYTNDYNIYIEVGYAEIYTLAFLYLDFVIVKNQMKIIKEKIDLWVMKE